MKRRYPGLSATFLFLGLAVAAMGTLALQDLKSPGLSVAAEPATISRDFREKRDCGRPEPEPVYNGNWTLELRQVDRKVSWIHIRISPVPANCPSENTVLSGAGQNLPMPL